MIKPPPLREIEFAFAAEAAAHAAAAAELNPFNDAESLELGDARAVYSGQWSPVHGVFGLGLDGPVEERDLREVEKFFFKKERSAAYWITPQTDPSLAALLGRDFSPTRKIPVHGTSLPGADFPLPDPSGSSKPDHNEWALAFTQLLDPASKEAGLIALTKLHQKDTRFYLSEHAASYTFFHRGMSLVPYAASQTLLALQIKEAQDFRTTYIAATGAASPLPLLYERILYERI